MESRSTPYCQARKRNLDGKHIDPLQRRHTSVCRRRRYCYATDLLWHVGLSFEERSSILENCGQSFRILNLLGDSLIDEGRSVLPRQCGDVFRFEGAVGFQVNAYDRWEV